MKLYLVRHAIAGERDPARWPDDELRPLTEAGAKRMARLARKLSRMLDRPDAVLSSPLVRAWQTAEIIQRDANWPAPQEFAALKPGVPPHELLKALRARPRLEIVAMVGHEPALSALAAFLMGHDRPGFEFKKGGAACIEFAQGAQAGTGQLRWLLTPGMLLG